MTPIDVGVSLSASASSSSGVKGDFQHIFGDHIAGGLKLPVWLPYVIVGALFVLAVLRMSRKS